MTNTEEQPVQPKDKKKAACVLWRSIGILFALFAAAEVIYLLYMVNGRFIEINQNLGQLSRATQTKIAQLEGQMADEQKNSSTALQNLTAKVAQTEAANKDEWTIAEARYLVKQANDKVQFEDNTASAILLLKMADKEVSRLTDPRMTEVRRALAVDITALQSVPQVDVTGLYMQLSALNGKVDQLPLINKPTIASPFNQTTANQPQASWWQRGLQNTWQSLRQVVVVRYNETGKLPLIPPDQQGYLYQNLHAVILQATWALLHGETAIYKHSLEQAATWVKAYCVENSTITQSMLSELGDLGKVDVHPAAPAITALQAFPE